MDKHLLCILNFEWSINESISIEKRPKWDKPSVFFVFYICLVSEFHSDWCTKISISSIFL